MPNDHYYEFMMHSGIIDLYLWCADYPGGMKMRVTLIATILFMQSNLVILPTAKTVLSEFCIIMKCIDTYCTRVCKYRCLVLQENVGVEQDWHYEIGRCCCNSEV